MLVTNGLKDDDVALIRAGAQLALGQPQLIAEGFYRRLFAARPGLRVLFPSNLRRQQLKLMQTLGVVLESLDDSEDLEELLRRLGAAHRMYGAKAAHYPIVTQALLDTVAEHGGGQFTAAHRRAWAALLLYIAQAMRRGADGDDG